MSGRRLPLFGAGRTLGARLITGVLLLLIGACAVIGVVTYLAIRGSMVSSLDGQLRSSSGTYAGCMEAQHLDATGQGGGSHQSEGGPDDSPPPPNNTNCSLGQPQGMLGLRIKYGQITNCGIVNGMRNQECPRLSAADFKTLLALPAYQPGPDHPPWSSPAYSVNLTRLDADYRMTAVAGHDNDILVTGLPLSSVERTLGQVALAELIVFLSVLLLAGVLGTAMVRLSLRPLRRVAVTAARVAELPLDSGEVSLPTGVPDNDPRTEVGRVGAAFNRMLYHVERALGRREASEARLRRFAADASHELRTPLSAIRGYAELALRNPGPVPQDVTHALRRIQSESSRMGVLVDDLLLLARLDAGRPLEREPVDLSRLVIETTSDARVARGDHRWRLDLPGEPVLVEGDEHRLHQVMANLLGNAGKHTPAGSTVSVALAVGNAGPGVPPDAASVQRGVVPPGPQVELSITDDGPGIAPELLPELFERFTRGEAGRARDASEAGKSTGLGLAIVDAVVAAHGGSIVVTSRPGMTRFAIFLPLLREPAGDGTGARADASKGHLPDFGDFGGKMRNLRNRACLVAGPLVAGSLLAGSLLVGPLLAGCATAGGHVTAAGHLAGRLVMEGGPMGPGGQQPGERPISGTVTITAAGHRPVTVRVGSSGAFSVPLAPGRYQVSASSPAVVEDDGGHTRVLPCSQPTSAAVTAGHTATITLACIVP